MAYSGRENHSGKNKKEYCQYLHVQYGESQKYYDKVWDGLGDWDRHTHILLCIKQVTNENLQHSLQHLLWGPEWEGNPGDVCIHVADSPSIQQKRTQHCKATILLLKKKKMPSEKKKEYTLYFLFIKIWEDAKLIYHDVQQISGCLEPAVLTAQWYKGTCG